MELFTQVKSYSSLKLFDIRSKNGDLLYQILFKCDLPGEGSPARTIAVVDSRQSTITTTVLLKSSSRKLCIRNNQEYQPVVQMKVKMEWQSFV